MFYFYKHFKSTPFHTFIHLSSHFIFQFLHVVLMEYACLITPSTISNAYHSHVTILLSVWGRGTNGWLWYPSVVFIPRRTRFVTLIHECITTSDHIIPGTQRENRVFFVSPPIRPSTGDVYIYIYMCVCVCVCVCLSLSFNRLL